MLENAIRICEASFGNLLLYEGDVFRHVALRAAICSFASKIRFAQSQGTARRLPTRSA
jgi:hypothetical protein